MNGLQEDGGPADPVADSGGRSEPACPDRPAVTGRGSGAGLDVLMVDSVVTDAVDRM
jgi:hypothetical protein